MSSDVGVLSVLSSTSEVVLYRVVRSSGLGVFLASTPESRRLLCQPEIRSVAFQDSLYAAIERTLSSLLTSDTAIGECLRSSAFDVCYILRGGLNFNLHSILARLTGKTPSVSFLSSQRLLGEDGPSITELAYQKWSLRDNALLCIGDISATGTTIDYALEELLTKYLSEGKLPSGVLFITIGTRRAMEAIERVAGRKSRTRLAGVTFVFLEAAFELFDDAEVTHLHRLRLTDFVRREALCCPEYVLESLNDPANLLERCTIYDGGSRAFEPSEYIQSLISYWSSLAVSDEGALRDLCYANTDLRDFVLEFDEWRKTKPEWKGLPFEKLFMVYGKGNALLSQVEQPGTLLEICKRRLAQLQSLQ